MEKNFKKYLESKGHSFQGVAGEYRQTIYFLDWCETENTEPEQATHRDLIGYIKHLQKRGIKQITVQKYLGSLKHYFNWLIKREIREDNPARNIDIKGVKRKSLYDIIKMPELETLYHNFEIPDPEHDKNKNQNWYKAQILTAKRNKVILGLMIWQGLGTAELARLEINDLKLREGKIYIAGSRKSNERELKLEAHQVLDLMEYTLETRKELLAIHSLPRNIGGQPTEQLFISNGTGANKLNNAMSYLIKKLNGQNPRVSSVKQIRASVITHWLKIHNLRETQYMAGHRYVSSTESYLINDLDDLSEDITKYHPIG